MGLDRAGNIVITSATRSPDLPTTPKCFQAKYGGKPSDWMVAKISANLKQLLWCTYIGGTGDDFPRGGLAIDKQDNVYIVGGTNSPDFPTSPGVFQRKLKGGRGRNGRDAAIVKLSSDGKKLLFGTLYGGSDWDGLMGIRLDDSGSFYVAGHTQSADLPLLGSAAQNQLGGRSDCFLAQFSPQADKLLYATYLGGKLNEFAEHRLYLTPDGTVLITGVTGSMNFPTTPGAYQTEQGGKTDGFLTQLSSWGDRFIFSTFLGGREGEFFLMPTPDKNGNIFLVGTTQSHDFPVSSNAIQKQYHGSAGKWDGDGALAIISADGSKLLYASYLGGSGADLIRSIALGSEGAVYLVGSTSSKDFPVTLGAAQSNLRGPSDAFVVKLVPSR
jgi:hypothetical protein